MQTKLIEDRFPDAVLLESFSVFDCTTWPDEYLPGDGEEDIEEPKLKHYQPVVENQATLAEWNTSVNVVQAKADLKGKDRELLTALVQHTSLQEIFPNLHKLAVIAHATPMSSADCERGFSALKRIKTRLWKTQQQDSEQSFNDFY